MTSPESLPNEFLTLEYWNKYENNRKHIVGVSKLDLLTAATGPIKHVLHLLGAEDPTKIVGTIMFDLYVEEMKNVEASLNITITPHDKKLPVTDYYMELSQILKSEQKRKKGRVLAKTCTLKKLKSESYSVEQIFFPNSTLKALGNEILQIIFKTNKRKNSNKPLTNAVARIHFDKFLSLETQSFTIGERILNQNREIGLIKATITFKMLPTYAQMTGGAVHHVVDGIVGGNLIKGAVEPIIDGKPFSEVKQTKRKSSRKPTSKETEQQKDLRNKHVSAPILSTFDIQPLPPGWEKKIDSTGRIFYVDHSTKSTQWEHPLVKPPLLNHTNTLNIKSNGTQNSSYDTIDSYDTQKFQNNGTQNSSYDTIDSYDTQKFQNNGTQQNEIVKTKTKQQDSEESSEEKEDEKDMIDQLKAIVLGSSTNLLSRLQNLHELPTDNDLNRLLGESMSNSSESSGNESTDGNSDESAKGEEISNNEDEEIRYPYFLPSESSDDIYEYDCGTIKLTVDPNDPLVEVSDSEGDEFIDNHVYGEPDLIEETIWG